MARRNPGVLVAALAGIAVFRACATLPAPPDDTTGDGSDDGDAGGGDASSPACQKPCTVAEDPSGPYALALDGTYVYWTSPTRGTVSRRRKDGQGDIQQIAFGQAAPKAITVSPTDVYWANTGGDGGHPERIVSQSLSCPANQCLTEAVKINTNFVRWDGTFLYYARDAFLARYDGTATVDLCDMGIPIVSAAVGKNLLFANVAGPHLVEACPKELRADASKAEITIGAQAKPLAAVAVIDSNGGGSISGSDVYITFQGDQSTGGGTSVTHVTATGDLTPVIASGQNDARAVAVDETYVYWTATGDGAIRRRKRDGTGGIDDLATGEASPTDLAIDGVALYWVSAQGIRSRAK